MNTRGQSVVLPSRQPVVHKQWTMQWWLKVRFALIGIGLCLCVSCERQPDDHAVVATPIHDKIKAHTRQQYFKFSRNVPMREYFSVVDSIVRGYPALVQSPLAEYCLIHHNTRIIDSLMSFDYYHQKKYGIFVYDLSAKIIFHRGDSLAIPDSVRCAELASTLRLYAIDINVPEFKLTVLKKGEPVFNCRVRVGKNAIEYIETAKAKLDLKTPVGKGTIVRVYRSPRFVDPHTGKLFETTVRDDGARTLMPAIPSIQPMINGVASGKLIHATTNHHTLSRAYSHGCVGLDESDMWKVYYYAPVGTPISLRYDLDVLNEAGDTIHLKDIYRLRKHAN